jgi:type IV secretion system protein VirB2
LKLKYSDNISVYCVALLGKRALFKTALMEKVMTKSTAIRSISGFSMLCLLIEPSFAQISKVNSVMSNLQTVLLGVAVTMFTIALMWAGFKMAFQHAKWSEISNIVIGGILVGGAAGIAAWLLS